MEVFFLLILVLLMVIALTSGFPVAFSLPGAAIISIGLAALTGFIFEGNPSAYFTHDGPIEWLTAGVTNFRSLYWDVERDTLIAIPLFVFMGIMLQRSKIAEDLLVSMAQLFGPIPGGLGISVVFVGALLAATTGIVGATVIAMGLISLPAMLEHNYSKTLATGTICASGTLGQIIPPSIVLIILADQLSNAAEIANTTRIAEYKMATGETMMPSEFDVISASAGDMFVGAFLPGLVLVGLYMSYILISALLKPESAPPVPYEGKIDSKFLWKVLMALVPPLTLIFTVLGSIIMGIATVNQAGAIGAIGAMIMGGYRLTEGQKNSFYPAILAVISTTAIIFILNLYQLNIKNIRNSEEAIAMVFVTIAVIGLLISVFWSVWRTFRIENTLKGVMLETSKTTSMVFIILIGAAMLTSAFRGFGGEEIVKEFLTSIPGGFWAQFMVVMAVIFFLGFFLDFIEISVVVVPLVAPILLADPSANITAVWLGVMIGMNLQTSFLTPPFGFALFYLRGVSPPEVKTIQIYRGVVAFIILQLIGLAIAGYFPPLVNYLPNRTYLTSENAPPPINPKLQQCIEEITFPFYVEHENEIRRGVDLISQVNVDYLPEKYKKSLLSSQQIVLATFGLVEDIHQKDNQLEQFIPSYENLHHKVRKIQFEIRKIENDIIELKQRKTRLERNEQDYDPLIFKQIIESIETFEKMKAELLNSIPAQWETERGKFDILKKAARVSRQKYRRNSDSAYEPLIQLSAVLNSTQELLEVENLLNSIKSIIEKEQPKSAIKLIKEIESELGSIQGASSIRSKISKARRVLKGNKSNTEKALQQWELGMSIYYLEIEWRQRALKELSQPLANYDMLLKDSIGLRLQKKLSVEHGKSVAACKSSHEDLSLFF
ncbi:MAG: TRAP transporter large permease subunit [SAR324 cluster bacterium]